MERRLNILCRHDCDPEKVMRRVRTCAPGAVAFTGVESEAHFAMVRSCIETLADDAIRYTVYTSGRHLHQDMVFFCNERYVAVVLDDYAITRFRGYYPDNPNYFELSNLHQVAVEAVYEGIPFDLHSRLLWEMKCENLKLRDYAYHPKLPCGADRRGFILPDLAEGYVREFEKHMDMCFRKLADNGPGDLHGGPAPGGVDRLSGGPADGLADGPDNTDCAGSAGTRSLHVLNGFLHDLDAAIRVREGCFCNHANLKSIETSGREILCARCARDAGDMEQLMAPCRECDYLPFCRNRCVAAMSRAHCESFKRQFDIFLRLCSARALQPLDLIGRFVFSPHPLEPEDAQ